MRKYIHHIRQRPTHERRLHAMRVSGVITALVFVGWVTTLGVSMGTGSNVAQQQADTTQTAAALQSGFTGNQLIVSTTTNY